MKSLTPLKAIKKYCFDCSGNSHNAVKFCHIDDCPLHPFRFGKNPNRSGLGCAKNFEASKDE